MIPMSEDLRENTRKRRISFVIPCYRSSGTIGEVAEGIRKKMEEMSEEYELILVNDCSPDDTFEVIRRMAESDERITAIDFSRNFGQHAALMAGIRQSRGDIVVCLDDDGQTPPEQADRLIAALDAGADAVYARYHQKKHSLFRNFGSAVNEKMLEWMLEKPRELYISSYFAVKRHIADEMIRYENSYPYVIGLVLRSTGRIVNVDIDHRNRMAGTSGYSLKKLFGLWMNGFTAFSVRPLRIATVMGCISAIAGFIYGIVIIIQRFVLPDRVLGFTPLVALLVFFGGMIMIMLGLVGEYIGRIYISLNSAPQYVIREKVSKSADAEDGK